MVTFDIPYGYGLRNWDKLLSQAELNLILKKIAGLIESETCVIAFYCLWSQASMVKLAFESQHFVDCEMLTIYKYNQNAAGNPKDFVHATEIVVIGYKGGRAKNPKSFLQNHPQMRHNLIFTNSNRDSKQKIDGKLVNPTEKPHVAGYQIADHLIHTPGSNVLVIGAGAGGDLFGFLANPKVSSITAIEKDPTQYIALHNRLTQMQQAVIDFNTVVLNPVLEELKKVQHLKQVVNLGKYTFSDEIFSEVIQTKLHSFKVRYEIMQLLPDALVAMGTPNTDGNCSACNVPFTINSPWVVCDECAIQFHPNCLSETCGLDHQFCSTDCLEEHGQICDGLEKSKQPEAESIEYTCNIKTSSNVNEENGNVEGYQIWPRVPKQ